ncbi:sugar efflux transporter [Deinococcus rubellus]|uniref:sugar efflux transporter n=1 Tax=Deinococcus rubellus TaxID=1889240 RepID=UPI0031E8CD14
MEASALRTLWQVPGALRLGSSAFLLGLASSFAGPYLPLFGVQAAHLSPLRLGLFLTWVSLCSILISTVIGRWSDRLPNRRPALLLSLGSAVMGYLLLTSAAVSYPLLLLVGGLLLGTGASAFPQLFAYARVQLTPAGESAAQQGLTTLRSIFSLAWVVGPLLGAALLSNFGFGGLFGFTAAAYTLGALPLLLGRSRNRERKFVPPAQTPHSPPHTNLVTPRQLHLIALAFVLYATALSMGSSALPLYVTQTLGGSSREVGWLIGLCALLEIPVMLSFVLRPRRTSPASMMVLGFGTLAAYVLMVSLSGSVGLLAAAQLLRAIAIGISAGLGMAYFQDLMPGRVGASTTLFANTSSAGSVVAGTLFGVWAQLFGYHSVFGLCAVLAVLACGLMLYVRHGKAGRIAQS